MPFFEDRAIVMTSNRWDFVDNGGTVSIQEIQVNSLGTGLVSFTIVVRSQGTLKNISLEIDDLTKAILDTITLETALKSTRLRREAAAVAAGK